MKLLGASLSPPTNSTQLLTLVLFQNIANSGRSRCVHLYICVWERPCKLHQASHTLVANAILHRERVRYNRYRRRELKSSIVAKGIARCLVGDCWLRSLELEIHKESRPLTPSGGWHVCDPSKRSLTTMSTEAISCQNLARSLAVPRRTRGRPDYHSGPVPKCYLTTRKVFAFVLKSIFFMFTTGGGSGIPQVHGESLFTSRKSFLRKNVAKC